MPTLVERVDDWFSLEPPVTYRSLWMGLLRASPVLLVGLAAAAAIDQRALALVTFAPVPYVFFVATLGFAVRELYDRGIAISVGLAVLYTAGLAALGVLQRLLSEPTVLLGVITLLTSVAGIAGFMARSLHSGWDEEDLEGDDDTADFYDERNPSRQSGRRNLSPYDDKREKRRRRDESASARAKASWQNEGESGSEEFDPDGEGERRT